MKNQQYVSSISTPNNEIADNSSYSEKYVISFDTISASSLAKSKVLGWTLANSFDYASSKENEYNLEDLNFYETANGNPAVTKELIHYVSSCGFQVIRIPISFTNHHTIDSSGNIVLSEQWISRIKEIVDYCMEYDLLVILVPYNDYEMIYTDYSRTETNEISFLSGSASNVNLDVLSKNVGTYWNQLAESFRSYDKHVVFENFCTENLDVYFDREYAKIHNRINQVFVETIRESSGNNKERLLVINTYLNGMDEEALSCMNIPKDSATDALLLDIFCKDQYFDQSLEKSFISLESYSNKIHLPIMIGKFYASEDFSPSGYREKYAANFVKRANSHGLICCWWDNGDMNDTGIINRTDFSASNKEILDALNTPYSVNLVYFNDTSYSSTADFSFQTIDEKNGKLIDSENGSLTLTSNSTGYPVEAGHTYMSSLSLKGSGLGMNMTQICYYDSNMKMVQTVSFEPSISYCFTAPSDAAYVRIVAMDPRNTRTWLQYESMLNNSDFILSFKEYSN